MQTTSTQAPARRDGTPAPHSAGCRQMVLEGGQHDRAALREVRGRSLDGLAALPAILSGGQRQRSPDNQL